jgi:PTH1 family peptidyl-tRNA hydrolase
MISAILGLGNIGSRYKGTRHNFGFMLLDFLCQKWQVSPQTGSGDYYIAPKELSGHIVRLVWPTTYVNNSGFAAKQVLNRFNLTSDDLLAVHDDFELPLGKIRIRLRGSDGGHNGMQSLIFHLETEKIARIRMGIGPVPEGIDRVDFVLGKFDDKELKIRDKVLEKSAEAVLYLIEGRLEEAMNIFNRDPAPGDF